VNFSLIRGVLRATMRPVDQTKRRVRDLHRMNMPPAEIARALSLTKARVYQLLAELKCKPNPSDRSPAPRP